MDWSLLAKTFLVVFLAELGDKTQLATLGFSASGQSRLSVFLGAGGALLASTLVAVAAGSFLGRTISPTTTKTAAGILFLILGAWMLLFNGK